MSARKGRRAAGLAWTLCFVSIALAVAGTLLALQPGVDQAPDLVRPDRWQPIRPLYVAAFSIVGALIVGQRPTSLIGWLSSAVGLLASLTGFGSSYASLAVFVHPGSLPAGDWLFWLRSWSWFLAAALTIGFLPLLFPDGRLPSPRWRPLAWLISVATVVTLIERMFNPEEWEGSGVLLANPAGVEPARGILEAIASVDSGAALAIPALGLLAFIPRWQRGDREVRQQLKWFLWAVLVMVILNVGIGAVVQILFRRAAYQEPIFDVVFPLSVVAIPVSIGIAILRYRLYDIDVVINRTAVIAVLTSFTTVTYVTVVVGLGALVGSGTRGSIALSTLATAMIALAFQPVREVVQQLADRLVYGRRAAPYEALARFSRRIAGVIAPQDVTQVVAQLLGQVLRARRVRVTLLRPGAESREAWWPSAGACSFDRTVEVRNGLEVVGEIAVLASAASLTPAEDRLLTNFAAQTGTAFRNLRLTSELQARLEEVRRQAAELRASRRRILVAADLQRQRLERAIAEGPQRHLDSIGQRLESAESLLQRDGQAAGTLLAGLTQEANQALDSLRNVARGLFPRLLTDMGVLPALNAQLKRIEPVGTLWAAPDLIGARFDPEVEATAYFCCLETLRGGARVRLSRSGHWLELRARSNSGHVDPELLDRVAAVGGSVEIRSTVRGQTLVVARIPT